MQNFFQRIISGILPFIGMLVFFILFIIGLIFFSYLILLGAIVGFIAFAIFYLRAKYLLHKHGKRADTKGRTIDHQE